MIIEVPDWCVIGKAIQWNAPSITGYEWVVERIVAYDVDGFYHQAYECPMYFTKFSEYGKTIRECE